MKSRRELEKVNNFSAENCCWPFLSAANTLYTVGVISFILSMKTISTYLYTLYTLCKHCISLRKLTKLKFYR